VPGEVDEHVPALAARGVGRHAGVQGAQLAARGPLDAQANRSGRISRSARRQREPGQVLRRERLGGRAGVVARDRAEGLRDALRVDDLEVAQLRIVDVRVDVGGEREAQRPGLGVERERPAIAVGIRLHAQRRARREQCQRDPCDSPHPLRSSAAVRGGDGAT
jgi:hypothetical protein